MIKNLPLIIPGIIVFAMGKERTAGETGLKIQFPADWNLIVQSQRRNHAGNGSRKRIVEQSFLIPFVGILSPEIDRLLKASSTA